MNLGFPETPFILETPDAHLSAVLHRAPGTRLVIQCHGFTGNKVDFGRLHVQTARALQKAGINALRFDFMGSGDSSGDFSQMSPNTEIRDLLEVYKWARRRYTKIAFLGHSLGGAVAISAAYLIRVRPQALLTWATVPSLKRWNPVIPIGQPERGNPLNPGRRFYTDRPRIDTPEAYCALDIPRLQIQGDHDNPGFLEDFTAYCPRKDPLVRHLVLQGADHCFTDWKHRRRLISESVRWLKKHLA